MAVGRLVDHHVQYKCVLLFFRKSVHVIWSMATPLASRPFDKASQSCVVCDKHPLARIAGEHHCLQAARQGHTRMGISSRCYPRLLAEKRNGAGAHLLVESIDGVRETCDLGADMPLFGIRIAVGTVYLVTLELPSQWRWTSTSLAARLGVDCGTVLFCLYKYHEEGSPQRSGTC